MDVGAPGSQGSDHRRIGRCPYPAKFLHCPPRRPGPLHGRPGCDHHGQRDLYEKSRALAALQERQRLAQNLHDAVNQSLFSAGLIAEVLPRLWDRDQVEARQSLEDLRRLTRGALAEMRALLAELRPSVLTDSSLGDLLRQLANAFTGRTNIPVSVNIPGSMFSPRKSRWHSTASARKRSTILPSMPAPARWRSTCIMRPSAVHPVPSVSACRCTQREPGQVDGNAHPG